MYLKCSILLFYLINIDYSSCEYRTKIVGGRRANIKNYPFLVAIITTQRSNSFDDCLCSGTILNPKWILTAGHCLYKDSQKMKMYDIYALSIVAGSTNCYNLDESAQIIRIKSYTVHPNFVMKEKDGSATSKNDIALLLLEDDIQYGYLIKPVNLITPIVLHKSNLLQSSGTQCEAMGWGLQNESDLSGPSELYKVNLPIMVNQKCAILLQRNKIEVNNDQIICTLDPAGHKDVCQGDSGGPLICNGYQVGVVSLGSGCANANSPNVWTRVDVYHEWIKTTAQYKTFSRKMRSSCSCLMDHILSFILLIYLF